MNFYLKYLKYKNKYIKLKLGGTNINLQNDINKQDENGNTALHNAILNNNSNKN